ncbi:MAG: glucose-1-phosphate thymidylyltransferase RfbA [Methylocystis sp.]|nr:glucose-1-phosphate thymidylyltransferase RfbA [Methylocystis sp.]
MKGIVLAGGAGTRLYPATLAINKQLLPIYDKPMIYYPVSVLLLAGIREILIISTPEYVNHYKRLFDSGEQLGISFEYATQPEPGGLAQAFIIGREFIGDDSVALVLGDNIFFGAGMTTLLKKARSRKVGATVFGYHVEHPQRYGIVTFDPDGHAIDISEKPQKPESNWAVTGLYFYDNKVTEIATRMKPSARGELEITDINRIYLELGELFVERLSRGYAWFDMGTHDSLLEASEFVRVVQHRQGLQVACLEEIAFLNGFIDEKQLLETGKQLEKTTYGQNLLSLAKNWRQRDQAFPDGAS